MRKILIIARREYLATVATKAFVIGLALMPVFMVGGIAAQAMLRGRVDTGEKKIAVLDQTGKLFPELDKAVSKRNAQDIFDKETKRQIEPVYRLQSVPADHVTDEMRLQLSDRVRRRELFAFVEIPARVLDLPTAVSPPHEVMFYAENILVNEPRRWLAQTLNRIVQIERLRLAGLDPAIVARSTAPVPIEGVRLVERTESGKISKADKKHRELSFFIPMGVMMLMVMAIFMTTQPLLQSVIEEKQQRIAEVLLGSVNPFQLMMGKLFGNVAASLTMATVYIIGAYGLARYYNVAHFIPASIVGWFIIYQILAVLLYGSVFISIGAACTNLSETQSFMTPIMLVIMLPMFVWFNVLQNPMSSFAMWLSLIPPSTPILMVLRLSATTTIPIWQPLLGIIGVLATMSLCVFAAGRIFRIGILSQGNAPKVTELMRWVATG